ncbi:MAG: HAMP domain-containing histidine kinase [Candidatus Saccharimonas sp.]|nr:HAMP domain-containing histidine kinase [Planctomycetaceae bacterium]
MFLTRSIRRKLVIGLGLVLLMLVLLGIAGLSGLWSYRSVVHDLQAQLDTEPRRTDLAVALATLIEPLMGQRTRERQELQFNSDMWTVRLDHANRELREYRRRVVELPRTPDVALRGPIIHRKLDQIQQTLSRLDRGRQQLNTVPDREALLDAMLRDIARLQTVVQEIPNSDRGFHSTLLEAAAAYRWRLWLIGGCLVLVLPLLASLYWCGYVWFFVRVRKLHDAAARVANGNYQHRLSFSGRDEMVDLAESFNRMIDRFQRDKSESDREAQCRGEQIVRNKHLVDLGQMASGIAHEINNPLSAISMAADSLAERLVESDGRFGVSVGDQELLRTYLTMIQQAADRCQGITKRTLEIARGNNGPRVRYDVTKIVVEVLDRLRHVKGHEHIVIEFDRSRSHPADVNAGELVQVVQNLVMNALEAMEGMASGTVTISLDESVDEVILSVRDTGCGMTPHVLSHLYKPFFTKRASGKGTGLGLSIVDRIVGEHGGRIEALSDGPGQGSTFRVHLPRRATEASHAA